MPARGRPPLEMLSFGDVGTKHRGAVGAGAEEAGKRGGREKAGTKGQAGESQGQRIQKSHGDRKDGWD